MGYRELIDALRREGAEKAAAIRKEAETEAEALRRQTAERIDSLRAEYARRSEAACAAIRRDILAEAERKARQLRLTAEHSLATRLLELARKALPGLRDERQGETFAALAAELPPLQWGRVRVNPADEAMARRLFADAEIETDAAAVGGMEAEASGGRFRVVNTLEKRLERGWPELLPRLLAAIRRGMEP